MDIYCRFCGEPWDIFEFETKKERDSFKRYGCGWEDRAKCKGTGAHPGIGVLTDLCGDDIDGLAADLDDFKYAGLL